MINFHILFYFRNSTHCLKTKINVEVLENEPGLCYNTQATFPQRLHIAGDGSLVCPYLDFFKDEKNELPRVQWYKVICLKYDIFTFTQFSGLNSQIYPQNLCQFVYSLFCSGATP